MYYNIVYTLFPHVAFITKEYQLFQGLHTELAHLLHVFFVYVLCFQGTMKVMLI